jgi:hypothetical protein
LNISDNPRKSIQPLRLCLVDHSFNDLHHQPLDDSYISHPDPGLTPDPMRPDQFQNCLSELPLLEAQSFNHSNNLVSPPFHSDPLSCPVIWDDSPIPHSFQEFDPDHQPLDSHHYFPSLAHDPLSAHSNFHIDAHHLRSGSTEFTPSSPANIKKYSEVLFNGPDQQEHTGTIMEIHPDNTYKIQTSDASYDRIAYHSILKYGSKK